MFSVMAAHVINEYIIINCTSPDLDINNKYVHFLTHIGRQHTQLKDIISDHIKKTYTSEFNVWYLSTFFQADISRFVSIPLNHKNIIKIRGKKICFEFLDANHCPGAVMILLKGDFGNYLYTGNCRYTQLMTNYFSLRPFSKGKKVLDRLYINGAYQKLGHNFPSRAEVTKQIIKFICDHKEETIYICARLLGKEDILAKISSELNIQISVDEKKMKVLKYLGYDMSLFTRDSRNTRVRVVSLQDITWFKMKRRRLHEKCVAIVLTAYDFNQEKLRKYGIYVFPASDHSSYDETKTMINCIKSNEVFFLNENLVSPIKNKVSPIKNKGIIELKKKEALKGLKNDNFEKSWEGSKSNTESSDDVPVIHFNITASEEIFSVKQSTVERRSQGPSAVVETVERVTDSRISSGSTDSNISLHISSSGDETEEVLPPLPPFEPTVSNPMGSSSHQGYSEDLSLSFRISASEEEIQGTVIQPLSLTRVVSPYGQPSSVISPPTCDVEPMNQTTILSPMIQSLSVAQALNPGGQLSSVVSSPICDVEPMNQTTILSPMILTRSVAQAANPGGQPSSGVSSPTCNVEPNDQTITDSPLTRVTQNVIQTDFSQFQAATKSSVPLQPKTPTSASPSRPVCQTSRYPNSPQPISSQTNVYPFNQALHELFKSTCPHLYRKI